MGKLGSLACFLVLIAAKWFVFAQTRASRDEPTFKISTPLEFKGRVVSGSLRRSEIALLLDLPVRNGNSDLAEGYGAEMIGSKNKKFTVYTCREWKKAREEKAYSATTFDMAMESSLIHTCGVLLKLQRAKAPLKSFVARVTLSNIELLPAEILTTDADGENGKRRLRGLTISQVVPAKDIEEANDTVVKLRFDGFRQTFWDAARADFDGNGFKEILVFTGGKAEGGTLGYADCLILTRRGASGPLQVVQTKSQPR